MTKNTNIKVNPITETIEVSSTFLKKALVFDSPEYFALKEVRAAEPCSWKQKTRKKISTCILTPQVG